MTPPSGGGHVTSHMKPVAGVMAPSETSPSAWHKAVGPAQVPVGSSTAQVPEVRTVHAAESALAVHALPGGGEGWSSG